MAAAAFVAAAPVTKRVPPAEALLPGLKELKRQVQELLDAETTFRKANLQNFGTSSVDKTTQLLLAACEKLFEERAAIERSTSEEHSVRLEHLCKQFGTSLDMGLSEAQVARAQPAQHLPRRRNRGFLASLLFGMCCEPEFPPRQRWWLDISRHMGCTFQVLRGGRLEMCAGRRLCPGDVVYMRVGQKVPADCRVLVHSDGATVDCSHLTACANDLRVCCHQATAATASESRNIVLKDSYIVSGALFCMVVRMPSSGLLPPLDSSDELIIDTAVPVGLSQRLCQGLFKALCTKSQLVCKSFDGLQKLGEARAFVVQLTPELLSKGTIPAFCASVKARGRRVRGCSVTLVDCGCGSAAVEALCAALGGARLLDFSASSSHGPEVAAAQHARPQSRPWLSPQPPWPQGGAAPVDSTGALGATVDGLEEGDADALTDYGTTSVDVTMCFGPMVMRRVSERDEHKLRSLVDGSLAEAAPVAVVTGISQELLIHLCTRLVHSTRGPLLYAMSDFHFPRCLACLSAMEGPVVPAPRSSTTSAYGMGQCVSNSSTHCSTSRAGGSPNSTSDVRRVTLEVGSLDIPPRACEVSGQSRKFASGAAALPTLGRQLEAVTSHVLLSVNSMGVVSEKADCVLLEADLARLARALELLDRRLPLPAPKA